MALRALAILVASCGRYHFDPVSGVGLDGDTVMACVDGDGICPVACVGADSDCVTTCGDTLCVGNAGETCVSCSTDCNTLVAVCGNGLCDGGETTASCETDCGPLPWPLVQEEAALLVAINNTRVGGITCPGDTMMSFAPALAMGADPTAGAHHLVWQVVHQPFPFTNLLTCNGVGYLSLINAAGYEGGAFAGGATSAGVINALRTDGSTCRRIMMTVYTEASIGMASDATAASLVFLR